MILNFKYQIFFIVTFLAFKQKTYWMPKKTYAHIFFHIQFHNVKYIKVQSLQRKLKCQISSK